jgi:hypothetical protein
MATLRLPEVSPGHRGMALFAIIAVLGVCGWTLLQSRKPAAALALKTGDLWPRRAWDAMDEVDHGGNTHLVLFAPGCRWCHLQLSSLETLVAEPVDGVRTLVVVVAEFDEAKRKLSGSPLSRSLVFVPRVWLNEDFGAFPTPTHVILNGERRVLAIREGYLTRAQMMALREGTMPSVVPRESRFP